MNEKPALNRPAAAVVAFLAVGGFSPLGMKALDYLGVKAPLSDWILSAAMFLMMLGVYHLLRRSFVRGSGTVFDILKKQPRGDRRREPSRRR